MPIRQRMNEWSEIGMKFAVGVRNFMAIVIMGFVIYFMAKIAFAFCYFIIKLAGTLPTWPAR